MIGRYTSTAVFGDLIRRNSKNYTKICATTSFTTCTACTTDKARCLKITHLTTDEAKDKRRLLDGVR